MYQWFSKRAQRATACEGECFECREHLSNRLLWPVQATVNEEPQTVLLCLGCVAVEMLRVLTRDLDGAAAAAAPSAPTHRCDRCQRGSRPTHEHHGFHLCGECSGEGA
jgi:hypothetical protein